MSNLLLVFDPHSETKKITRTSADCCGSSVCEYVTETSAPLPCEGGDKVILFFKDPTVLVASANGVLVGNLQYRRVVDDKYHYYVSFDDALLAAGVAPNTLTQCDVLKACCYDCAAEYADAIVAAQHPAE